MTHHQHLTYAPLGRTGWITVFCRRCRCPVWYARNAAEAAIYVRSQQ